MPDFSPVFQRYEKLRDDADKIFAAVNASFPQCVTCHPGCCDCCSALFDLSLVEAMYINNVFSKKFGYGRERSNILEKASRVDRQLTKIKRELFRAEKDGESPEKIMRLAATARMPCPLLDDTQRCLMYEARPITCRLYGIPLAIGKDSHVCGFSNFDRGGTYPTAQLGKIQAQLEDMSREIAEIAGSKFELSEVYVPLSMALLTRYDDAWLGIGNAAGKERE